MELSLSSFLLYFSLSSLILQLSAQTYNTAIPGTIERAVKQQVLVAIPPGETTTLPPFLTSPTGKYAASFLRNPTAPGAGGFGNDFCYIEVTETASEQSVWESECSPASTSNTCSLVFSDDGLEIFDGSNSAWSSDAQSSGGNPLQSLELVDEGDMRIRDKEGELAWKASDDPRSNQRCGEAGSPGLTASLPPFAQPEGGNSGMVFGQQAGGGGQMVAGSGGGRIVRVGWVVVFCFMIF